MTALALDTPWQVGDWLLAAEKLGIKDARTELLKQDPRWEGTEVALWIHTAESFPPHKRNRAPFNYYAAVSALPVRDALRLLDMAVAEEWSLADLKKELAPVKKALKEAAK